MTRSTVWPVAHCRRVGRALGNQLRDRTSVPKNQMCSGALYLMCASLATRSTATNFSLSSRPVLHLNQSQLYFFGVLRESCDDLICRIYAKSLVLRLGT